jgi:hypothetical protein
MINHISAAIRLVRPLVRQLKRSALRVPPPVKVTPNMPAPYPFQPFGASCIDGFSFEWGEIKVLPTYDCLKSTPTRSEFALYSCHPLFASLWRLILHFSMQKPFLYFLAPAD